MSAASDTTRPPRPDPFPTFRAAWRLLSSGSFWRRCLRRLALGFLLCIAVGYVSAFFGAAICERDARDFLTGLYTFAEVQRPLFWVPPSQLIDRYAHGPRDGERIVPPWTWRSRLVGLHMYVPPDTIPLPWAYAFHAPSRYPFVVIVHYGCFAKDLYGEAGVRIYLVFFRWHLLLARWPIWFS